MNSILPYLVQILLKRNKISIDTSELKFQILSHPTFPSLHSITGVLDHFNIENVALDIPRNLETIAQLPNSFLAQIKDGQSSQFVLLSNKGLQYELTYSQQKKRVVSVAEFLDLFTGIIVVVEKDENAIQHSTKEQDFTKPLTIASLVLFIGLFFWQQPTLFASSHFILSLIGIALSILILQNDLGIESKIMSTVCSGESKATNCNAVLNSKGATLFNNIKLSDVSLIYFAGISLAWLFLSVSKASYNPIIFLSILALPAIVYSIYYQYVIAKNWCLLCLSIASVLLLQVASLSFTNVSIATFSFLTTSSLFVVFSLIATSSTWLFLSIKMKNEKNWKQLKIEHLKFKRNFKLFDSLLEKSAPIDTYISDTSEIIFGNKNAALSITVVTNPFCGHCKEVHTLIGDLLNKYSQEIQISIRFNISTKNKESDVVKITSRLLEIYNTKGEKECLKAMHRIYAEQNAASWLTTFGNCIDQVKYFETLEKQNKWCVANSINFTPEILINGRSFPKEYGRKDLLYFIEDLHEKKIVQQSELVRI